ncbi:hypothetical protein POM88_034369 [Heracleum sosnowskyi]|uniref:DYW domain-containing protein n=1 Tax=Heracleum sosnowskyi TaxID=360622 RepID=A0AAD8HL81_9APIA|nr:hypothetical protein POM88_034369 [Heracleum sosnowskyi]
MAESGLTQTPGFSFVEVKKKIYKFVSQDMAWPQCNGVYDMLHQMEWQLKFEGYSEDTSQVLLDVDEEEKMERLSRHSQKLAIAFALIHTSEGSPIRIHGRNVSELLVHVGLVMPASLNVTANHLESSGNRKSRKQHSLGPAIIRVAYQS